MFEIWLPGFQFQAGPKVPIDVFMQFKQQAQELRELMPQPSGSLNPSKSQTSDF